MEAGKFFVNLGLTGTEKTLGGLSQVNSHFAGLKGISTEAKLAILGALAGLEQMVSISGRFGNELTKSTQFLNVNKVAIQQWENAAQRMGAPVGALTDALQKIQDVMNDIWAGKGPPQFMPTIMSMLTRAGEKFSPAELAGQSNYWQQHPLDFFQHIVHAANLPGVDRGRLGYMLSQMGINQDILNVARMGAFSPANLAGARRTTINQTDIEQLNKMNQAWEGFELNMKKAMHLFSEGFLPMVQKLEGFSGWFADRMEGLRRDVQFLDRIPNLPQQNDQIFYQLHPELLKLAGHETQAKIEQNFNFSITGVNPADHPGIKRAVKEAIKESNKKERTGTISTTSSTSGF
ncbi:MAG TPA: hypothetical protein VMT55_00115 [Candidatus Sulfotelmatobacter sp.]|nr:hypothetical protein [Candidatus Sulfotelmatobacter sp.]